MYLSWRLVLAILLSIYLQACSTREALKEKADRHDELMNALEAVVNDPNLQNAQIGIYIESLEDGYTLYRYNEHKLFIPASNMKLFTTAAALINLGPEWRYETKILAIGNITDGALTGNLIIKGQGDPSISGRFYDNDCLAIFNSWADSLRKKGIRKINGDLIADDTYFSGDRLGNGWQWDDETYYYSAQTAALSFNDNCIDISVFPAETIGAPARIRLSPDTDYVTIINTTKTTHSDTSESIGFIRRRAQNIIELTGTIPLSADTLIESISVEDPPLYFVSVLYESLQNAGIEISGKPRMLNAVENDQVNPPQVLFIHKSPELAELIKVVNKPSHNFYAEQLLKTMGALKKDEGSFGGGTTFVAGWLNSIGVPSEGLIMADGSGLSRMNVVSPNSVATLLRYMFRHKKFGYFYESLPIAGVDGSLKSRMASTAAQGNVHAKTGFVRYSRNLSGYVRDARQRPYLFVLLFNHFSVPVSYVNTLQDRICVMLSNYR